MIGSRLAYRTYEALAPTYDILTEDEDYDDWLQAVEALALERGIPGRRVLDVACGTGRSSEPLVARGYDVSACDISPAMVRRAARRLTRAGGHGQVAAADMRDLPQWGRFDLITCLNDAVNYLLDVDELDAAFASVARSLRPGGLYFFDVASLSTYGTISANPALIDAQNVRFHRHGQVTADARPNAVCTWRQRLRSGDHDVVVHAHRHWPIDVIRQRLERAGLRCIDALGQQWPVMHPEADEAQHRKVAFVARLESAGLTQEMGEPMILGK